jgi:hypothetical protein
MHRPRRDPRATGVAFTRRRIVRALAHLGVTGFDGLGRERELYVVPSEASHRFKKTFTSSSEKPPSRAAANGVNPYGHELDEPGTRSFTITVPQAVPSVICGSLGATSGSASRRWAGSCGGARRGGEGPEWRSRNSSTSLKAHIASLAKPLLDQRTLGRVLAMSLKGSNRLVVIENQLEATDHRHLGQLLTYAAGKEAGVVVWISPEFRDEHREALDWLNREGGEGRPDFFGVELQVLQIDDSKPAINLRPVAFPNDWTRDLNQRSAGGISDKRQRYQQFFQALLDDLREQKFSNAKKAQPQSWYSFASGASGYTYAGCFATGRRIRAELYIDQGEAPENKAAFEKLYADKDSIEADFGDSLTWEKLETKRACRIAVYTHGSIDDPPDALAAHRAWIKEKLILMKKVFGPRIG